MERLDYYDIMPKGMDAYLASHGHHISKPMLEWAVGMMRDRAGNKVNLIDRKALDEMIKANGIQLRRKEGFYDPIYVYCMAKSDYLGSSITDEARLVRYVVDYIDDEDGNPTRAFDELYINCLAKGIDIPWAELI
jgi:hypothetical protein